MRGRIFVGLVIMLPKEVFAPWCHLIGCYDFGSCAWGGHKWIGHYYCPGESYPWRSAGPWCCHEPCCPEEYYFPDGGCLPP